MRDKLSYIILLCLLFGGCRKAADIRIPSLNESYEYLDKKPFGGFVTYNRFSDAFPESDISIVNESIFDKWPDLINHSPEDRALYCIITQNLLLSKSESDLIVDFVNNGNDIFIAADYVSPNLPEDLNVALFRKEGIQTESAGLMQQTHVGIYPGKGDTILESSYYYYPFLNYLAGFNKKHTRILGTNEAGRPNFVVFFIGKGRLYLHVAPRAFSNYFLLTRQNYNYLDEVLSWLDPSINTIYWDEYYKEISSGKRREKNNNRSNSFSTMRVISQYPPLLWAFSLAVALILLLLYFNSKRKQRIIPVIPPNVNATVAFTETIGRLYFQNKNNRNIADKQITYFYENIRNKYFINFAGPDADFIAALAGKSGVPVQEVTAIFSMIASIQASDDISDEELMDLNKKLEHFNKLKN